MTKSEAEFFIYHWQIVDMAYRAHGKGATLEEIMDRLYHLGEEKMNVSQALEALAEVGLLTRSDEESSSEA